MQFVRQGAGLACPLPVLHKVKRLFFGMPVPSLGTVSGLLFKSSLSVPPWALSLRSAGLAPAPRTDLGYHRAANSYLSPGTCCPQATVEVASSELYRPA